MTFRIFVVACSMCGACTALLGWALGRAFAGPTSVASEGLKGLFLGMLVAFGLCVVDALCNIPSGKSGIRVASVFVGMLVGSMGGLIGGIIGEEFYMHEHWFVFLVMGWTITGVLIGASIGTFQLLAAVVGMKPLTMPLRQVRRGVLGGCVGGILGGVLALWFRHAWEGWFHDKPSDLLWSPSAGGFIVLGACIGLAIGLARVILREAWVRVEHGYRAGRELLLSKPEVSIGRAEGCDIGLFGDSLIERLHARIVCQGDRYSLTDVSTPGGTYVNGQRVHDVFPLTSGDRIQLGNAVLVFYERRRAHPPKR